ncbi:hypothetical protein JI721_03030 [Alicyclobacillus cycloheptanicus]|uniref:Maff2 family protein n=1 Tax=Alicyclobacillus cycloheptanicus TaxID=1457 RepID=A0ABT9XLP4_9BACL|nr:hypothetical protein [Alicyclobacillus cycloheptanicus]MDQ0190636.1 hypothetical protein [Alicyclobacillus cycloheptanicus]WDM01835.1 hypothetical protein JI721_03030 [Alicyclobacillus cycloheptanicus]
MTRIMRSIIGALAVMTWPFTAFASSQPQFVSGIYNMLNSIDTWLLFLTPVSGGVMIAYHQLSKMFAGGDFSQTEQHNRATKKVLVAVVIVELAMAGVKWLISTLGG